MNGLLSKQLTPGLAAGTLKSELSPAAAQAALMICTLRTLKLDLLFTLRCLVLWPGPSDPFYVCGSPPTS